MKLSEITEGYSVGSQAFAFNPARRTEIVPVHISQKNFMGKEFKVVYLGMPQFSGNGGIWAANTKELYKTKEEAEKVLFKDKLTGKR